MRALVRVVWTDHALLRASEFGITHTDAEAAVLEGHAKRTGNPGDADWLTAAHGLVVAYDWPTEEGPLFARLVTVWLEE